MSWIVVWHSRPGHVHQLELGELRGARRIANSLQRQQGSADVIDKSSGVVVYRPSVVPARPRRMRSSSI